MVTNDFDIDVSSFMYFWAMANDHGLTTLRLVWHSSVTLVEH